MLPPRTPISIFLASPSDVAPEREVVERIVQELNLTIAPALDVQVELVRWETHVRPGVGTDPQDAITRQIGIEFDIVLGLFWGRVGTPTPRAGSGTLDELETALARWQLSQASVEVMIYFKTNDIPFSQLDPDQIKKLFLFKESLPNRGVLYKDVLGSEFEHNCRIDLTRAIVKLARDKSTSPIVPTAIPILPPSSTGNETDEDEGIEDLISQATADLEQAATITSRIKTLTDETTAIMAESSLNLEGPNRRDAMDSIALALQTYSERLVQEAGQLGYFQDRALSGLGRGLVMAAEDGALKSESGTILFDSISRSSEVLTQFAITLRNTRAKLTQLPRLTRQLNLARRSTGDALDLLISKIEAAGRTTTTILSTLSSRQ